MSKSDKVIVPESIECSTGAVGNLTYRRVFFSLTLLPDKIVIEERYRMQGKVHNCIELTSLEEYNTWWKELRSLYGNRITRKKLHYVDQVDGIFKYTDYKKATNHGMRTKNGVIAIPKKIHTEFVIYLIQANKHDLTIHKMDKFNEKILDTLYIKTGQEYKEWFNNIELKHHRVQRREIKYFKYEDSTWVKIPNNQ